MVRRREVWRHSKSNLWNYGIGWQIHKEEDEKSSLDKIQLDIVQIGGEI